MAHRVKCRQCGESFDRDTTSFVEEPTHWYYHTSCYQIHLQTKNKAKNLVNSSEPPKEKNKDYKICPYCKQSFDLNSEEWVKPSLSRYAHKKCYEEHHLDGDFDSDDIYYYLKDKVHLAIDYRTFEQQRIRMVTKNGYTNEGILNALMYWYDIKKNSTDKANGGIGIVPYIYEDAQKYYANLAKKQKEINKSLQGTLNVQPVTIKIQVPEKITQRELINLDDIFAEETEDEEW